MGLTVAGIWACVALRRRACEPGVLAANDGALRASCLGFPVPVLLAGWGWRRVRDAASGVLTVAYRVPNTCSVERVHAYYREYLEGQGFRPAPSVPPRGKGEAADGPATGTVRYVDAMGLRAASVSVVTHSLRGRFRTVVVSVRPARAPA